MPTAKKNSILKASKKRVPSTVVVIETRISAKDTLFPEKVAEAKKMLRKIKFHDPKLFF